MDDNYNGKCSRCGAVYYDPSFEPSIKSTICRECISKELGIYHPKIYWGELVVSAFAALGFWVAICWVINQILATIN